MRYIIDSATLVAMGTYCYEPTDDDAARDWLVAGEYTSAVASDETAGLASTLLGIEVPVSRIAVRMSPGDEALVVSIVRDTDADTGSTRRYVVYSTHPYARRTRTVELGLLRRVA